MAKAFSTARGAHDSLYRLRHVHSTLRARAKVHPSVMQRRLGPAAARTTLELYTDLNPEDQSEAALASALLTSRGEG